MKKRKRQKNTVFVVTIVLSFMLLLSGCSPDNNNPPYIGNTKTLTVHKQNCKYAKEISEENKTTFYNYSSARERKESLSPCKECLTEAYEEHAKQKQLENTIQEHESMVSAYNSIIYYAASLQGISGREFLEECFEWYEENEQDFYKGEKSGSSHPKFNIYYNMIIAEESANSSYEQRKAKLFENDGYKYDNNEKDYDYYANQLTTDMQETDYILNKNTKKFHYPDCYSVGAMKEKNKIYFSGYRDEVLDMGYVPCKNCNP